MCSLFLVFIIIYPIFFRAAQKSINSLQLGAITITNMAYIIYIIRTTKTIQFNLCFMPNMASMEVPRTTSRTIFVFLHSISKINISLALIY